MCDCQSTGGVTRGQAIAGALVAGSSIAAAAGSATAIRAAAPAVPPVQVLSGLWIYPRDAWDANLPPVGPIQVETPQFLLVHHTASSNSYGSAAGVIQMLPETRTRAIAQSEAWKTTLKPARRLGVVAL